MPQVRLDLQLRHIRPIQRTCTGKARHGILQPHVHDGESTSLLPSQHAQSSSALSACAATVGYTNLPPRCRTSRHQQGRPSRTQPQEVPKEHYRRHETVFSCTTSLEIRGRTLQRRRRVYAQSKSIPLLKHRKITSHSYNSTVPTEQAGASGQPSSQRAFFAVQTDFRSVKS